MRWCFTLLWCLMILLPFAVNAYKYQKFVLPKRCEYLKDSKQIMYQKCKGKFPLVAYTKFRDTFMKQDDRMALFMPKSLEYVMVALKESELHNCASIRLVELKEYICYDEDGGKRTVKFKYVRMYCFPFHIQITDDLTHECIADRDGISNSQLEQQMLETNQGIIHYVFDNDLTTRLQPLPRIIIIITTLFPMANAARQW
ncbi:uncharacterized protein LOC132796210 [Drosophila nasuta]|uniref:uncharacterized protein LOC132796210 n=1 Tax=Drosophila nasuta TaxID=42062 RepID=UPI00295ECF49|nr:uncharacterized protein LOC132796210 [Drosophila nasuta]